MKIQNPTLHRISSNKIKTNKEVFEILEKDGFKVIGEGARAVVYSKKYLKFVIKIFCIEHDPAYHSYLKTIQKMKNKYVPKVYNIVYKSDGEGVKYAIVYMEKLKTVYEIPFTKIAITIKKYFGATIEERWNIWEELVEECPKIKCCELKKLWNKIHNLIEQSGNDYRLDLHEENIMYRKNGHEFIPIIADPLR